MKEKNNERIRITDIALVLLSALYLLGMLTVFGPCGPKEDGSYMNCHYAGIAVTGTAALLLVLAALHLLMAGRRFKTVLSLVMIPAAAAGALIPGNVIHLCMMTNMRCHAVMRPAAMLFSAAVILAAAADLVLSRRQK